MAVNATTINTQFSPGDTVFYVTDDELFQKVVSRIDAIKTNSGTAVSYSFVNTPGQFSESVLFSTAEAAVDDLKQRILAAFSP